MRNAIFLAGMLLLCFACSNDEEKDENSYGVSSDYYFAASMDGVPLIIEADNKNYYNYSGEEGEQTPFGYVAGRESYFGGLEEDGEQINIFFLKTFESEPTDCSELSTILNLGSNSYAGVTSFEDLTVSDGVVIYYVDGNGVEWSTGTADGDFSDGEFKITEITKYKNDPTTCVVKARFSCTLYNEYGTSVELTGGELCAMFPSCAEPEESIEGESTEETGDLEGNSGTFVDARDNHEYSWVRIGDQIWMAENLAYLPESAPMSVYSNNEPYYFVNAYAGTDVAEAKATENYAKYGVLYNWDATEDCAPEGWAVPTKEDWEQLLNYIMANNEGNFEQGRYGWEELGEYLKSADGEWHTNAGDKYGFDALPGGYFHYSGFETPNGDARWWTSTADGSSYGWDVVIDNNADYLHLTGDMPRGAACSIRCIKK